MAETVELPAIGRVKSQYVWAGGALVAGIAGYAWWRSQGSSDGGDVVIEGADVQPEGEYEPPTAGAGTDTGSFDSTQDVPDTNAEWSQMATEKLAQYGYDPTLISAALGRYLTRADLTQAQADLVRAAVGILGYPPEGGADMYPIKVGGAGTPSDPPPSAPKTPGRPTKLAMHKARQQDGPVNILTFMTGANTDKVFLHITGPRYSFKTDIAVGTAPFRGRYVHFRPHTYRRGDRYKYTLKPYNGTKTGPTSSISAGF